MKTNPNPKPNPMKILFMSWAYPKENTPYLGIWAHQQAKALQEQGIAVEVVNMVPYVPQIAGIVSGKMKQYAEIPKQEQFDGILVQHPKFLRTKPESVLDQWLFHFFWLQSKRIAAELGKTMDLRLYHLIHAHNLFPDGAIAYFLHKKYNIPYILTLHAIDKFNSPPAQGRQKKLSGQILLAAEKVLVVSKRVKRNIHPYVNEERLQLLYNTFWTGKTDKIVSTDKTDKTDNTGITGKNGSGPQAGKTIVTIASLIESKGIDILIRAFNEAVRQHPEYELMIIGGGPKLQVLTQLSEQLQVNSRVTFTGALEHAEAMVLLAQASIFCLPSWEEAFGVVYAEAMSFAIPVIGCVGEGIEDIVADRVNGVLVEPKSVEALETALLFLIENEETARQIGIRGKESISELHSDIFGEKLVEIYSDILIAP
ncbi:glycosyltransferase [Paenibacillus eucommiae]|uniref:Glycosyltransferase involved in cell wall biosynthesis n=1 Tax=Paenibacillus eucommiae TaxID=1355755 RepID=A0ABS4J2B7_9BACL|nr:glycosyltransferase [Paenibacillus eucommiae]MBP1993963.1 glycosyltransferase involved in cell wall biosynthesis [Paenibacillus eucommiae]